MGRIALADHQLHNSSLIFSLAVRMPIDLFKMKGELQGVHFSYELTY